MVPAAAAPVVEREAAGRAVAPRAAADSATVKDQAADMVLVTDLEAAGQAVAARAVTVPADIRSERRAAKVAARVLGQVLGRVSDPVSDRGLAAERRGAPELTVPVVAGLALREPAVKVRKGGPARPEDSLLDSMAVPVLPAGPVALEVALLTEARLQLVRVPPVQGWRALELVLACLDRVALAPADPAELRPGRGTSLVGAAAEVRSIQTQAVSGSSRKARLPPVAQAERVQAARAVELV